MGRRRPCARCAARLRRARSRRCARSKTAGFDAMFDDGGVLAPLYDAKCDAARALLVAVRAALDAVPGPRRRLEPQAFPPPFHRISGFPMAKLAGIADAVGIKLYTMHWPMIARYWARDLLGDAASAGPRCRHGGHRASLRIHRRDRGRQDAALSRAWNAASGRRTRTGGQACDSAGILRAPSRRSRSSIRTGRSTTWCAGATSPPLPGCRCGSTATGISRTARSTRWRGHGRDA